MNTRDTVTGEVVHKIVVDVNTNGETKEVVLAELSGLESAEGKWGDMRVRYENGKADYYVDYTGTSGSVQAKSGD